MNLAEQRDAFRSLLDAPSPAVLTLYRADGSAIVSPVWFRVSDDAFEVVIAAGDAKLAHLERDSRCILVIFETVAPFRRVEVRGGAALGAEGVAEARLAIATRYLGTELGRAFAEKRGERGLGLRLPLTGARASDLGRILPP